MSRPIKMTEDYLSECRKDFEKALGLAKLADGKLNFTKQFTLGKKNAVVYFTPMAWAKMVALIQGFNNEVAWHGVARRGDDPSKDAYIVSDILVYPQSVTGATVEMDTEEYAKWIMENVEDERFNSIFMQGHSHVNMQTSPSSVDLSHQEEILNMLDDDDFYIFMIWNKSFASTNKIYDMRKNILFENADITVKLAGGDEDLDAFVKASRDMVKQKTYAQQTTLYKADGPYNPVSKGGAKDDKAKGEKPRTRIGAGWAGAEYYSY